MKGFEMVLVILIMMLGMDMITRVHPAIHRIYLRLLTNMVWHPLQWVLHRLRRGSVLAFGWVGRQIRHLLRFIGRQMWRGAVWTWRQAMDRLALAVLIILALVLGLGLALLTVGSISSLFGNTNWGLVGLVTLGIVLVTLIVWLFVWSPTRRGDVGIMTSWQFWKRLAATVVVLTIVVTLGIICMATWKQFLGGPAWMPSWSAGSASRPVVIASVGSYTDVPTDTLLQVIADCESGDKGKWGTGRQKDEKGNLIIGPKNSDGSVDRGKWQINSKHDPDIAKRQIDITTEEGNRQYAVILMQKNPDLSDWDSSRHCWEPILIAMGRGTTVVAGQSKFNYLLAAGKDWKHGYKFVSAHAGKRLYYTGEGPSYRYAMKTQTGRIYNFTPEKSDEVKEVVLEASFMSLGETPENIRIEVK